MWLFGGGGAPQAAAEVTDVRSAAPPRGKVHFRPQLFFQRVMPEHVVDMGCEIRLSMAGDGHNSARLRSGEEVAADGEYARSCAVMVADAESRGDEAAVAAVLRAASTWGDAARVRAVLSSCYCTPRCCSEALAEAAACGHDEAVQVLLDAGAPLFETVRTGKTPLHLACEGGHEAAARVLLRHAAATRQGGGDKLMGDRDDAGRTAVELAQANEMGPMGRRLQGFSQELLREATGHRGTDTAR
jgi:hypothetical protein